MSAIPDKSAARHRQLLTAALLHGPVTTIAAREELGIQHPAGRIKELRAAGYSIATLMQWHSDSLGLKHRIAAYVLMGGCHE